MAISEKILDFGKNKGKALGACEESYLKWLAAHARVLRSDHRHFAIAAKALLEQKEAKKMVQPLGSHMGALPIGRKFAPNAQWELRIVGKKEYFYFATREDIKEYILSLSEDDQFSAMPCAWLGHCYGEDEVLSAELEIA